jgi:hypothetical protein
LNTVLAPILGPEQRAFSSRRMMDGAVPSLAVVSYLVLTKGKAYKVNMLLSLVLLYLWKVA